MISTFPESQVWTIEYSNNIQPQNSPSHCIISVILWPLPSCSTPLCIGRGHCAAQTQSSLQHLHTVVTIVTNHITMVYQYYSSRIPVCMEVTNLAIRFNVTWFLYENISHNSSIVSLNFTCLFGACPKEYTSSYKLLYYMSWFWMNLNCFVLCFRILCKYQ